MLDLIEEQLCPEFGSYEMISATSSKAGELQSKTRPNSPAYWIFLPGLLASTYILWEMLSQPWRRSAEIALTLLFFFPSLAGLICLALGQRVASFVCGMTVVGLYWTATFFLLFAYTRESWVGLIYVIQLFLPAVFIALATTDSMNKRLGHSWGLGTVGIGLLCGAIGAGAVVASKEAARIQPIRLDPLVLRSDMITINKCSQEFAGSNPEKGYPESLGQLGPRGTRCLPEALWGGQDKGFTITYESGAKDANGKIDNYKVIARETTLLGKDTSGIFSDESGLIRLRFDGPHGEEFTSDVPSPSTSLRQVLDCVRQIASGPVRVNGILLSGEDEIMRTCFGIGNPHLKRFLTGKRKLSERGYDFEYHFAADKNGAISGFTVEARPQPYGVDGVRSYLAVETGDMTVTGFMLKTLNVYATPEDRPATVNDPLARASEVGLEGYLGLARLCVECAGDTPHSDSADKK
jgi:hypothetical protein